MTDSSQAAVCDAGPIIHLDEIDALDLLAGFAVRVPDAVWQEVARHRAGALSHAMLANSRVINTTFDEDHVGGNATLGASATIIGHENTRNTMLARPAQYLREYPGRLEAALRSADTAEEQRLRGLIAWAQSATPATIAAPELTFASETGQASPSSRELRPALAIHLGSETVRVWVTHAVSNAASETVPTGLDWRVSRTHAVVHFEQANVACMSDLFFHDVVPFEFAGTEPLDRATLERVIAPGVETALFVPGHGAPGNVAGVEAYRRYVFDVRRAVSAAKNAGKSKDEFLDEVDLPAYRHYEGYPVRFKENCAWQYDHFLTR